MDKTLAAQDLYILEIARAICFNRQSFDKLKPHEISFVVQAYDIYLSNPELNVGAITDLDSFCHFYGFSNSLSDNLTSKLKKEAGIKEEGATKEISNIDPNIGAKVALNKDNLASRLDTDNPHSVTELVKRARKTWLEKEKVRLIYKNADKERQKELEEKSEERYRQSINPKAESRSDILKNTYKFAEIALLAQGGKDLTTDQFNEALENIVYLAETGAIEIDNYNDLNTVSSLAIKEQTGRKTAYDEIDRLVQEKLIAEETDPYSDKADEINSKINRLDFDNTQSNKEFVHSLYVQNEDYDVFAGEAQKKEISLVINKLSESFPKSKLLFQQKDPLAQKAQELEKIIRQDYPSLNVNPSGLGARVSETVKTTGGKNATAIDLYSKGVSPDKLKEILDKRDSKTSQFLKSNRTLQKQIEFQLKQIKNSKLGKELDGAYKKVNYLLDPIGSGRTYLNKQIGKYAGNQIKNQFGEAVSKRFEKYLLDDGLKAGAKKFADEVTKKLIVAAAKKAGVEAGKVAAMAAGESALAAASVALGISTAGLSLIIEAGILLISVGFSVIKKGYQEIKNAFGITEEDDKENKKALLLGLGALAATAFAVNRGAKMFGTATKAAVISAVGIIWLSLATIAVFLTLTFLTAPILSTLVQFDSVEKVKYGELAATPSGDCAWPIAGKYQVIEGPLGGTHSRSSLQAIDIWGPDINGKPLLSPVDGNISFVGDYSNYGNSVKIEASNTAGKFTVIFGHMSGISVKVGQSVKQGQKIGLVDSSLLFNSPHIHMEYVGIDYNKCPAGGKRIKEHCVDFVGCGSIYTN